MDAGLTQNISVGRIREFQIRAMEFLAEEGAAAAPPMLPECQVAVLIPTYDESVDTLLRPLLSLAGQQGADRRSFEINIIVNNSRKEAASPTPAFLANQDVLDFIGYLNGRRPARRQWDAALLGQAQKIKDSGIIIRTINKSDLKFAEEQNHATHAHNRGWLELACRFLSVPAGLGGIVAMTDADCRLSPDYIASIIKAFRERPGLSGAAGTIEHEIDQHIPYAEIVERAFDLHWGGGWNRAGQQILLSAQDMAVKVSSWLSVGGVPDLLMGEDIAFGRMVEELPGAASRAPYKVFPLTRISERAGMSGHGRKVKTIVRAVSDFMEGRTLRILMPIAGAQLPLIRHILGLAGQGRLSADELRRAMEAGGWDIRGLENDMLENLVLAISRQMVLPFAERDHKELEKEFLARLYGRFPVWDVTESLMPEIRKFRENCG